MKTIKNLQGTQVEGAWMQPVGAGQTVMETPARGFVRHTTLSHAGLIISRGAGVMVGIPLEEIIKIAVQYEPRLAPPPVKGSEADPAAHEGAPPEQTAKS